MRLPERHRQRRYRSQIIGYLFLLVLVIIFIATVGVKLLINTSLFIIKLTQRSEKSPTSLGQSGEIVLAPEIFDLPDATNSAVVEVSGRGKAEKTLLIYVNEELQKETVLDADEFEAQIELVRGTNSIYLIVHDEKTKEKKQSKTYTVLYKDEKPTLEISSPKDQEKTAKDETQVVGTTDKEVFIRINNLPVVTDAEARFTHTVRLQPGENKLTIEARDIAGNSETKELTVIYQPDN